MGVSSRLAPRHHMECDGYNVVITAPRDVAEAKLLPKSENDYRCRLPHGVARTDSKDEPQDSAEGHIKGSILDRLGQPKERDKPGRNQFTTQASFRQ